jgi:hypothetical protein
VAVSVTRDVRRGDRVRKPRTRRVYVVDHIDAELGLAHLREARTKRMDCAYLADLRRVGR